MAKQVKVEAVKSLADSVKQASALYFIDFTGVGANDFNRLRRQLQETGARVRVVKNRLMLRALSECGVSDDIASLLRQPTSLVLAAEDSIAPARVIRDMAKKIEPLRVKGAYLDARVYAADQFAALASLPTKDELRGQLVGALASPIYGFTMALDGLLSDLVYVLDQLREKNEAAAAA